MERLNMQTANLADEKYRRLAEMFLNAVTETIDENGEVVRAIDKDVLAQEINTRVVEGREERYQFTWPDKRKAIIAANAPSNCTLRPCREESVDFDTTQNLYIEGDNLEVLKLLRENYLGKVKMIYIDPPYNTGNDFVYEDDFAESVEEYRANSGQYDAEGNRLVQNTESNGRFHTDWLNMMYPRLALARNLLTDDGVIFISIDDNEVENLRKICDEVFGDGNFVGDLIWQKRKGGGNDSKYIAIDHEFLLVYSKNLASLPDKWRISYDEEYLTRYNKEDQYGRYYTDTLSRPGLKNPIIYDVECPDGSIIKDGTWQCSKVTFEEEKAKGNIDFVKNKNGGYTVVHKIRISEEGRVIRSIYTNVSNKDSADEMEYLFKNKKAFTNPKPSVLIKDLVALCSSNDKDSLILDFFSGSATTAHAVMQLNAEDGGKRRFIMVQLPEETAEGSEARKADYKNICEIGKERIRRAGRKIKADSPLTTQNLDTGFRVLKLDSSNMLDVYYTPEDFLKRGEFVFENIKPDRTAEDLLFQVMLELDVPLSGKIERTEVDGHEVWSVENGYLLACFDEKVTDATITAIAKQKPYYFVMRDASMADDSVVVNFEQLFKSYSPDTILKVL